MGTDFLEKHGEALTVAPPAPTDEVVALAALAVHLHRASGSVAGGLQSSDESLLVELASPAMGPWGGGSARLFGACNTRIEFANTGRAQEQVSASIGQAACCLFAYVCVCTVLLFALVR